jgi:transposase
MINDKDIIIKKLIERIELLEVEIGLLKAENTELKVDNAELKRRLGLDSNNSSKPPSSDGLGKKNAIPASQIKKPSKKTQRSKPNQLSQVANPDFVIEHTPTTCACGGDLQNIPSDKYEARQVFDLPEPKLEVGPV